jgi:uncharacterized membrane protein YqjE
VSEEGGTQGPATNLLRSLAQLGGTLLAAAQTRVELLTVEIGEDLQRGIRVLIWALVAALAGILGLLLAGITVIVYFWETHRIGASVGVTLVFLLGAAFAGLNLRKWLHDKPRLLDGTRTELERDLAVLRRDE